MLHLLHARSNPTRVDPILTFPDFWSGLQTVTCSYSHAHSDTGEGQYLDMDRTGSQGISYVGGIDRA